MEKGVGYRLNLGELLLGGLLGAVDVANCWLRMATMRFCSGRGGRGMGSSMNAVMSVRGIRDPVEPCIA